MRHLYKIKTLFFYCLLPLAFTSCKKNGAPVFPSKYYFKCTIDGVNYIDRQSAILPPGAPSSPSAYYFFSDKSDKYVAFNSNMKLESALRNPQKYSIKFWIPIDSPLEAGKKYSVRSIAGEEYLVDPKLEFKYKNDRIPYCAIAALSEEFGFCFGKGHVEFTNIDVENNEVKGTVDFEIPSPMKSDNGKILKVTGEFFSEMRTS